MNLIPLSLAEILEDIEGLMGCLQAWACGWVLEDNPHCNHDFPSLQNHGTKDKTKIQVLSPLGANPGAPPQTRELQSSIPPLETGKDLHGRREGTRPPMLGGPMQSNVDGGTLLFPGP